MNPNLLDRYLQDVSFWLPKPQRRDIVAELSDDLHAQVEEKQGELGRALTDTEIEEILTRWGHPMLVAQRYLPQRHLIGPVLFPIYTLVLKLALGGQVVVWAVLWIVFAIFAPTHRTPDLANPVRPFLVSTLWMTALVTAVFALVDRSQEKSRYWQSWTAGKLREERPARDPDQISRWSSVLGLVLGFLLSTWWLGLLGTAPIHVAVPGVIRVILRVLQPEFYWPILFVLFAGIVMEAVNLVRPRWTRRRATAALAIDAVGLAVVVLLATGPVVEVLDASRLQAVEATKWINVSWRITLGVIGLALVADIVQAARRVLGRKPSGNWAITFMTGDPR